MTGDCDAVVVGAGIAGLYALYKLRELGLTVRVYEAGSGVGGTWFWNRYPGARCDSESMDYSYSFSPELEQEWEWTERYPDPARDPALPQPRRRPLRAPPRHPVQHPRRRRRTTTRPRNRWAIRTDRGDAVRARYCVMAVGMPLRGQHAGHPGARQLRGQRLPHGALAGGGRRLRRAARRRDRDRLHRHPARSRRSPRRPSRLFVFQRTANYSLPARNRPLDAVEQRTIKAQLPGAAAPVARVRRRRPAHASRRHPAGLGAGADARGTPQRLRSADGRSAADRRSCSRSTTCSTNPEANETAAEFVRAKIREIGQGPRGRRGADARPTIRSGPSASASTPTTTRPTTATTSRSSTSAARRSRRSLPHGRADVDDGLRPRLPGRSRPASTP